jgi:hypothetical protein
MMVGLASIVPGEPPGNPQPGPGQPQAQLRLHRGGRRHRRQVNSHYAGSEMIENSREGRLYSVQNWAPADQHDAKTTFLPLSFFSPILNMWFRYSCFTCDVSTALQVFLLLFNKALLFNHPRILFQMGEDYAVIQREGAACSVSGDILMNHSSL